MKLEQLRYVMAIHENGSISKAAKALYLSQPNISSAVRALEQELGFNILVRNASGTEFTEQGLALVRHCRIIQDEIRKARTLVKRRRPLSFTLLCPNYPPVHNAFIRLCQEYEQQQDFRLVMQNAYQHESVRLLSLKQADLAIVVSGNMSATSMRLELEQSEVEYQPLYTLPCNINLSKDHPLLQREGDFSFQDLYDYPFVDYCTHGEGENPYSQLPNVPCINFSKLFKVDSGSVRSRIISATHAYGTGVQLPPERLAQFGLHCIPVPGLTMDLGYLRHQDHPWRPVEQRFLALLAEEMSFLTPDAP